MKKILISVLERIITKNSKTKDRDNPKIGIIPKEIIGEYLPYNPVIIEAGAHIGIDTIEMHKLWPKSTIYAFEPMSDLFDRLKKNTERLKKVICYPLALSDKTGTASMFISSGASDASSSLLPPKEHLIEHPDILFEKNIEVRTITLDDWVDENSITRVDLLWLDLQGYELAVLKASPRILKSIKVIHTEVCLKELYTGCPLYTEVRNWLEKQGFYVAYEEIPWSDAGNVLFVKQE